MKLNIVNNHVLVDVQTDLGLKTCVVDTGSPLTFFYDDVKEYELDGVPHGAPALDSMLKKALPQQSEIEELVGVRIDGLISADIMQVCGEVLLDFRNEEICFGRTDTEMEHSVPMEEIMGLPIFKASFNGHETTVAFDTGAMYPFVSAQLAEEFNLAPAHGTFTDLIPEHDGPFEAELHYGNITIAGVELGVRDIATAPLYDTVLRMLNVPAFIGINALLDSTVLISYSRRKIYIKNFSR